MKNHKFVERGEEELSENFGQQALDYKVIDDDNEYERYEENLEAVSDEEIKMSDNEHEDIEESLESEPEITEEDVETCESIIAKEVLKPAKKYYVPTSEILTDKEKNILAEENMSLVQYIVKKFGNTGIDYDELFSVALMGYTKAINSYNPTKKTKTGKPIKFSTFAYRCIENEIFYYIRNEKKVREKNISLHSTLSTDKNGNNLDLESTLSTEQNGDLALEDSLIRKEVVDILREVIHEHLDEKEQRIIKHRFGIDLDIMTQNELASTINMSQANVSKLEKGIIQKLKKILMSKYKIKEIDF